MIELDEYGLDELIQLTSGTDLFNVSLGSTINKVANQAATAVSRKIRDKYSIKAKDLLARGNATGGVSNRNAMRVLTSQSRGQRGDPYALIIAGGKQLPLWRFAVTPKSVGADLGRKRRRGVVSRKLKGQPSRMRHAFIAKVPTKAGGVSHTGVFRRAPGAAKRAARRGSYAGRASKAGQAILRQPIEELFGPSIAQMMQEKGSLREILDTIEKKAPAIFEHELRFRLDKEIDRMSRAQARGRSDTVRLARSFI